MSKTLSRMNAILKLNLALVITFSLAEYLPSQVVVLMICVDARHMGTAMKHPVRDRVKLSFVIFDI